MPKKILIGVVAVLVIVAIAVVVSFLNPGSKNQGENAPVLQKGDEGDPVALDKSITEMVEKLKTTCADFLKGDLSGDPKSDCPGFDKQINRSLCLYCYATKNQDPSLCGEINNDPALRAICQKALGVPIDNVVTP